MIMPADRVQRSFGTSPHVLLVASGYHLYREYLLRMVAASAQIWLFTDAPPTWEHPYIVGHTVVDTLDAAAMIEAARELRTQAPLHGVVCWNEAKMVQTARLAEALGLPGGDPEAVGRCRDKHRTRIALAQAGIGQAASVAVVTLEEARAAAERIGYPVVLKPRSLGASLGVGLVGCAVELEAAFERARCAHGVPSFRAGVLVEEYLQGPEISVDAACHNGVLTPLFVARKVSGFPPYFEETGHSVDGRDPLLHDTELLEVMQGAHRAVGYRDGITHTEIMLTEQGPKIIEINARLGGDLIPYVGYLATGIDPGRVAVDVACGVTPRVGEPRPGVAAVRFLYPECDVVAGDVEIDAAQLPPSVHAVGALAAPGQALLLPPKGNVACRYAYAIAVADSLGHCQSALDVASRATCLRIERHLAEELTVA